MTVFLFVSQVSDYPGGIAVVYGGFSRLVSQLTHDLNFILLQLKLS